MDVQVLGDSNPWWKTGKVPDDFKGKERKEYELLLKSTEIREVTIITGVRRSGKSTLMYQMADHLLKSGITPEQLLFVNLENPKLKNSTLEEIYGCYRDSINPDRKAYVFLDEIHRKEGWEQWIRWRYDSDKKVKFIISGSCAYLLKKEYSTLLTGRNLTFEVFPLSFREFLAFSGVETSAEMFIEEERHRIVKLLGEYLEIGGFPNVFFEPEEFKTRMLAQYFDDILYKDIIDRHNLNSQKARDLALYLITNFTSLMSLRSIRSALGISYESTKCYVSAFKDAFLLFTLDHISYSMKEQKTKAQKVYCVDVGLRNAASFKFSKDEGKLAENLAFLKLKREGSEIYYWKNGGEIDFVVKNKNNTLTAINVSYTNEIAERELKPLLEFKAKFRNTKEIVILTKDTEKTERGVRFVPLWQWLIKTKSLTRK